MQDINTTPIRILPNAVSHRFWVVYIWSSAKALPASYKKASFFLKSDKYRNAYGIFSFI